MLRIRILLSLLVIAALLVPGTASAELATPATTGLSLCVKSPATRSFTNDATVTVTGTTNGDAVSVVVQRKTIAATVDVGGTFTVPVAIDEGWHAVQVIARRGGEEVSSSRSILIDTRAPRIASFAARGARFSTSARSKRVVARFRVSEVARVTAVISSRTGKHPYILHRRTLRPGRRVIRWDGRMRRGRLAKPGIYRLTLVARDRAGNASRQVRRIRVTVVRDSRASRIVKAALHLRGTRYVWGGMSRRGVDCSGLVGYAYRANGIRLPRTSRDMVRAGRRASRSKLRPADILLFNTSGGGISHAALYVGRGRFIHASSSKGRVVLASLRGGYYRSRLVAVRRVVR